MKVVIDTNILVMTLTSRSPFHFIYQALISQQYTLVLSNKYVDCMVAGQADFLVTEDKHFNILNQIEFPDLKVINLESFSKLVKRNNIS